jgi:hypothetical protein
MAMDVKHEVRLRQTVCDKRGVTLTNAPNWVTNWLTHNGWHRRQSCAIDQTGFACSCPFIVDMA